MQNAVTDAVRRLRVALGDTQQQFAARTGLAISTVVRYELSRPPKGPVLDQFKRLAEESGLHDVARTFAYAMGESPETAAIHSALDALWSNREKLEQWPMLAHRIERVFAALVELKRRNADAVPESLESLEVQLVLLRSKLFGTAVDQMNEAAAKIAAENPNLSWGKAYERAMLENSALRTQYRQERADAAMGTAAEASLAVPGTRQHAAHKQTKKRKAKKS